MIYFKTNWDSMEAIIVGISVLLVFLTFLLNGISKRLDELRKLSKLTGQKKTTDNLNKELAFVFFLQALPIALIFLSVFWVILPRSWEIITTYEFDFWHFDELSTIYVLMDVGLLGMFGFAAIKAGQTVAKWIEKRK